MCLKGCLYIDRFCTLDSGTNVILLTFSQVLTVGTNTIFSFSQWVVQIQVQPLRLILLKEEKLKGFCLWILFGLEKYYVLRGSPRGPWLKPSVPSVSTQVGTSETSGTILCLSVWGGPRPGSSPCYYRGPTGLDIGSVSNTETGVFTASLRQSILSSSQGTLGISSQAETQPIGLLPAADACRAGTVPDSFDGYMFFPIA